MPTIALDISDLGHLTLARATTDERDPTTHLPYIWEDNGGPDRLLALAHEAFVIAIDRARRLAYQESIGLEKVCVTLPVPFDSYTWRHYFGCHDPVTGTRVSALEGYNLEGLRRYLDYRQPVREKMHRLRFRHSRDFRTIILSFPLLPPSRRQQRRVCELKVALPMR